MSKRAKVLLGIAGFIAIVAILGMAFGSSGANESFKPQNEFKLDPWISLQLGPIDMSINKAVLYLFLAAGFTISAMLYVANRMQARPNRTQTAVEAAYQLMRENIAGGNMPRAMATKWFVFIATLFMFIWVSNMIGYLPLPTNTEHPVDIFGISFPAFALYAATANLAVPLTLTLIVVASYHIEGIRAKGFFAYLKGWIPAGVEGPAAVPIFFIEVISQFVRIISLSVRLFANILAGHLLILFMAGGLAVLLGIPVLAMFTLPLAIAFYLFEISLIATLQAFIFATLSAIYFGGAVATEH
ncbi:MAG: F0F1 ATP synthase subunit A [Solirubrobacterales bacterium]|nr:F0F1 ATP synthase subunit A [Solirubrobacterales bacterium]